MSQALSKLTPPLPSGGTKSLPLSDMLLERTGIGTVKDVLSGVISNIIGLKLPMAKGQVVNPGTTTTYEEVHLKAHLRYRGALTPTSSQPLQMPVHIFRELYRLILHK